MCCSWPHQISDLTCHIFIGRTASTLIDFPARPWSQNASDQNNPCQKKIEKNNGDSDTRSTMTQNDSLAFTPLCLQVTAMLLRDDSLVVFYWHSTFLSSLSPPFIAILSKRLPCKRNSEWGRCRVILWWHFGRTRAWTNYAKTGSLRLVRVAGLLASHCPFVWFQ